MLAYAGKEPVSLQPVDVNTVVEETMDLLQVSIPAWVLIRQELGRDLPEVAGDPSQMRQVLMNLLINAAEAIGDADGVITVRTAAVQLDETDLQQMHRGSEVSAGPHVCLEVTDSGAGMNPATVSNIFDPFFSTKFTGPGLGLATVLGVVRGHHGGLAVQTESGQGTTFRVFLPAAGAAARVEPPAAAAAPAPGEGREERTVLLVDDEEDVR